MRAKVRKKFAVCVLSSRSGENPRADKRRLYSIWLADSVAFWKGGLSPKEVRSTAASVFGRCSNDLPNGELIENQSVS
jgi:hypothetical protein